MSEGYNTEPRFFTSLFNSVDYFQNENLIFQRCEKTGYDEGVTNLNGLIKIAKKYINQQKSYRLGYDKFIIFFDLDTYVADLSKVKQIILDNQNEFIFAFSNPAIELFLLMAKTESEFSNILKNHGAKILTNQMINNERYVYSLFKNEFSIDSKLCSADFSPIIQNYKNIVNNEQKFMNRFLDNADKQLSCNICYILENVVNETFDLIKYFE